jgi:hypothetical protein
MYGDEIYMMMFAFCLCIAAIYLQLKLIGHVRELTSMSLNSNHKL